MDRELAGAVFERWRDGHPVAETTLYKAASALGANPSAVLLEARVYSAMDHHFLEKRAGLVSSMDEATRTLLAAAAGLDPYRLEKLAARSDFTPDEIIYAALEHRQYVPDLENVAKVASFIVKVANFAPPDPAAAEDPMAAMAAGGGEQASMMAPPQQGAAVQQAPGARFKPSPTAPEQMMPDEGQGNLEALLAETQGQFGQQAQDNGGLPPTGQEAPPPPPPPGGDRVKQVAPNLDDETAQRYGEQLERLEQGINMQVQDPKQMIKFVKELQKVDGKRIDVGIKALGEQLETEQEQEMGVGQPTIDGSGAKLPGPAGGAPGGASGEGGGEGGPPGADPAAAAGGQPPGGGPPGAGGPPKPKAKPPGQPPGQPPAAQQEAVEKVARAARRLARSRF